MGLPSYYKYIVKKYPEIILKELSNIDNFYMDFNGSIYDAYYQSLDNDEDIIKTVLINLDRLIKIVNPKNLLFLAIDGVAPRAKMKQQRLRRFKSVYDKNIQTNIKKKLNMKISNYDKNSFTPGTLFMNKLNLALKEHVKKYNFKVIISDSSDVGEGEQKCIKLMKEFLKNNTLTHVIYGLDADLIMLLLSLHLNNSYIMRNENSIYKFIDMTNFKNKFNDEIKTKINFNFDLERVINDYVFICFLMGNDFLPHLPGLDIFYNGIDKLLTIYYYNLNKYNDYLLNSNKQINKKIFLSILNRLSYIEDDLLKYVIEQKNIRHNNRHEPEFENQYEKLLYEKENEIMEFEDLLRLNERGWKRRYYKHLFHLDMNNKKYISKICKNYFEGLQWNLKYYFDECPSWNWCYDYLNGPCLSDLYFYLKSNWCTINFTKSQPYTPIQQLLTVLPPQSAKLLPDEFQDLMTNSLSPLIHYYPKKIQLNKQGEHIYWKCQPKIPMIPEDELFKEYYKLTHN